MKDLLKHFQTLHIHVVHVIGHLLGFLGGLLGLVVIRGLVEGGNNVKRKGRTVSTLLGLVFCLMMARQELVGGEGNHCAEMVVGFLESDHTT